MEFYTLYEMKLMMTSASLKFSLTIIFEIRQISLFGHSFEPHQFEVLKLLIFKIQSDRRVLRFKLVGHTRDDSYFVSYR